MNKLLLKTLLVSSVFVGFSVAVAAHDPVPAEKMKLCFEKHSRTMDKPALKNMYDCYRVHGYLMGK